MSCHCSQIMKKHALFNRIAKVAVIGRASPCIDKAIESAFMVMDRFEEMVTRENQDSELMRLCAAEPGKFIPVSSWLRSVLLAANDIAYRTDGLFDVAAVGTDGCASWTDIDLSRSGHVRLLKRMSLSLGGIAKGFAVDLAIKALQEAGVSAGLVDVGGCMRAFGTREWRIEFSTCHHLECGLVPIKNSLAHECPLVPVSLLNSAVAGFGSYFGTSRLIDLQRKMIVTNGEYGGANFLVRAQSCAFADALTKVFALGRHDCKQLMEIFDAKVTPLTVFNTLQANPAR